MAWRSIFVGTLILQLNSTFIWLLFEWSHVLGSNDKHSLVDFIDSQSFKL